MAAQTPKQAGAFTPFLSQQLPGGSEILDRNLLAIQAAIGEVVDQFNRTVTFIGVDGGGGSPGPFVPTTRRINTAVPLAGGGALTADLTISLDVDGTMQVVIGVLGIVPLSGDVVTGPTNVATIQPNVVTYAKMQQESPGTLLGNPQVGLSDVEEILIGGGLEFVLGPDAIRRSALTGDVTAPAGSNVTTLASVITANTYGGGGAYIISETVDAKGRATGFSTTTTPLCSAVSWQVNQTGLSVADNLQNLVLPAGGGAPIILTAGAGVPVTTTLAANYGSSATSPPTYPFRVAWQKAVVAIDVGFIATSGPGSGTLVFDLFGVAGNPATPGNWTLLGTTSMTASNGANSFQTLGFTVNSIAVNTSLVLVAFRTDSNASMTITGLGFQAVCSLGQ